MNRKTPQAVFAWQEALRTKRTVVAAIIWVVAMNSAAQPQATDTAEKPITIQVMVSGLGAGTPAERNSISVTTEPSAKFSVDVIASPPVFPPDCPAPAAAESQKVGTRVEGTIKSEPDGRFRVNFTITQRAVAGCRMVGALNIPVFSNRVISNVAVVVTGEVIPLGIIEELSGDPLKLEMALTSER